MKQTQIGGAAAAVAAPANPLGTRRGPWAMASLALAMLSSSLGTGIVNVALPTLTGHFQAPVAAVQWVVIAYLLTSTAAIVAVGRLGDLLGQRRLLLAGLALFLLAAAAAGLAPSLAALIAARAVQGVAGAVLMALTVALARSSVERERTGAAMGLLGTMSAVGTALGPSLGGAVLAGLGWRAVFFATLPLTAFAFGLASSQLPRDPSPRAAGAREGLDGPGTVLLATTLAAFALAVSGGAAVGPWRTAAALTALGGLGAFVLVERRAAAPLIPLQLLQGALGGALLTNVAVATVMMATLVVGPFYLVQGLGLEALPTGLVMTVGPAVAAAMGLPAGRLVDRFRPARVMRLGLVAVGAGAAALASGLGGARLPAYVLALVVTTAGYALFAAANNTAVMADVPTNRRGVVAGLLNLSRNLGLMIGATVLGAVFSAACQVGGQGLVTKEVVVGAMRTTFLFAASAVGAVLVVVLARNRVRPRNCCGPAIGGPTR